MDWIDVLEGLRVRYPFVWRTPLKASEVAKALSEVGLKSPDFLDFYCITNGLRYGWLNVLPIEDSSDIKHTWDGIIRANDPSRSPYFRECPSFFHTYTVFCTFGGNNACVVHKTTQRIWYQQNEELIEVDTCLAEFIAICLQDVDDLVA